MPTGHRPSSSEPGLVHVSDEMPGIHRVRRGRGFAYRASSGSWLTDNAEIKRIRQLAIPPAYRDVWICPLANGHLQATGRDARGRKQYRYHPRWRASRESDKFERMVEFGQALPRLRARIARDLRGGAALSHKRLRATLLRLLDTTLLRIGNEEYARSNGSFGLTTLRNPHAQVSGSRLRLRFRGKSGVPHDITVEDPRLARIVRRCQGLPGQDLFQYEDEDGTVRRIGSADVNSYLGEACDAEFTAKDFRTWHASVQALELTRLACEDDAQQGFNARSVLAEVARRLRNTPAVCKSSYIHTAVLKLWEALDATPAEAAAARRKLAALQPRQARRGLQMAEQRLLLFLKGS